MTTITRGYKTELDLNKVQITACLKEAYRVYGDFLSLMGQMAPKTSTVSYTGLQAWGVRSAGSGFGQSETSHVEAGTEHERWVCPRDMSILG